MGKKGQFERQQSAFKFQLCPSLAMKSQASTLVSVSAQWYEQLNGNNNPVYKSEGSEGHMRKYDK